jgi:pyruvate dehydrogenase E2 component (dihydrolipoamide acetyltransferase)
MNAPLRQFASPYARKLARERGIALLDLRGSGPSGRIVAADVLTFVKPPVAIEPVPSPAQPESAQVLAPAAANTVAALATQIDLSKLDALIEQFAGAQLKLSTDAILLRAAARGLAAFDVKGTIGWEMGRERGDVVIADADRLSLAVIQTQLDGNAVAADGSVPPVLSIRRLQNSGIRAVSSPLRPGYKMRLILSGDDGIADCLLAFDAASIDEDLAVDFLARLKDDLEAPLRLLA